MTIRRKVITLQRRQVLSEVFDFVRRHGVTAAVIRICSGAI
jgi:hypothetical protein